MSEKTRKQTIHIIENINLGILTVFMLFLPLFFLSITSDPFTLSKQMLLILSTSAVMLLLGIKTILEGKLKLRTTPFDLPIILLTLFALISAIFSINRIDALIAFTPFLFTTLLYFSITNTIKQASQMLILITSLVIGTTLSALITTLSYFQIYPLPFPYTQITSFNTFGSLLDQAIFFGLILPIAGYFVHSIFTSLKNRSSNSSININKKDLSKANPLSLLFAIAFFVILCGIGVSIYQMATTQKPLILPFETAFQTGFASISQDSGRVLLGFLFGSGPGTYITDFTRFKPETYNLDQNLWAFTFFRSSSYALELLATNGMLGLLSFIFLVFRILKEKSTFIPIIIAVISAFILPYSPSLIILFFALMGIFAAIQAHNNPQKFAETELYFVALKHGLLVAKPENENIDQTKSERKISRLLPFISFIIMLIIVSLPLYFAIRFFISDIFYQSSLIAYSQNDGLKTYNLQQAAINTFPVRDLYHRAFSQTNIALANSLATQAKDQKDNQQAQQNILLLIQQAITAGRNASLLSPQTSFNWNNLSSIYRNLIGFGQNAEQFAILTMQQSIALDPNNPSLYIDLGGIYYQIGQFDNAIREFQTAIKLKNDYPNAYYNLGHSLEMKNNLQEALVAYQVVKSLVASDKANLDKINVEISALEQKIKQNTTTQPQTQNPNPDQQAAESQDPLQINQPGAQLPERDPKIKITGPSLTPSVSPTPSGKPSASTTPSQTSPTPSTAKIN